MSVLSLSSLEELLASNINMIEFNNFVSIEELKVITSRLLDSFHANKYNLSMKDGIFFPFPYSSVHKDFKDSDNNYFKYSESLTKNTKTQLDLS